MSALGFSCWWSKVEKMVTKLSGFRYLPRWVVLGVDICFLIVSLFVTVKFLAIFKICIPSVSDFYREYGFILLVNIVSMFVFRTYAGIIRHSTFIDLFKILLASVSSLTILLLINKVVLVLWDETTFLTLMLFIYSGISFLMMFLFRLVVKEAFYHVLEVRKNEGKTRVVVMGIDEEAIAVAKAIIGNPTLPYQVVGFLTRRSDSKVSVLGKKTYHLNDFLKDGKTPTGVDAVVLNSGILSQEEKYELVGRFLERNLQVLEMPSVQKLRAKGEGSIRNLQIEDLLNRAPIVIKNSEVAKRHFQKNVLITGGAGSIGSEIVRFVATFKPSLVVVLDQAETPLYDIELEMRSRFPDVEFKFVLADISNYQRMEDIFKEYQFSMVYHAAAYKHVPMIEENPHEAVLVNVQGSKNLALLASKYNVNRFVMVSTDKAVNPTNVMGASKRAAELFVQALQTRENNTTKFITTRFGNVLGSNGSVIPHFKKQIEKGGPVTITHPDIVRYFMTIPEACELVLEAGTMGQGGEIFVFDMGEPVKILDLAIRMIKLSGYEPNVDIEIVYTGLRPGEKLYEELLSDNTKTMPTHHTKIMISKDPAMAYVDINRLSEQIFEAAQQADKVAVVKLLKTIVREFRSNNSVYEELDGSTADA